MESDQLHVPANPSLQCQLLNFWSCWWSCCCFPPSCWPLRFPLTSRRCIQPVMLSATYLLLQWNQSTLCFAVIFQLLVCTHKVLSEPRLLLVLNKCVCVCVCVCIWVLVYVSIDASVYFSIWLSIYRYIKLSICLSVYLFIYLYLQYIYIVYMCVLSICQCPVHICVCMHVCIYLSTYLCQCIFNYA